MEQSVIDYVKENRERIEHIALEYLNTHGGDIYWEWDKEDAKELCEYFFNELGIL